MTLSDRLRGVSGSPPSAASDAKIIRLLRYGAVAGVGVLLATSMSVLYPAVNIAGAVLELVLVTATALAVATLLAWRSPPGRSQSVAALVLAALLLGGGFLAYLATLPPAERALITPAQILSDSVAMLTGMSILRLLAAGSWALSIAPAPTFLAWYLALRGEYRGAVVVSGALLGLFVLTGDAGTTVTLVAVVAAGGVLALESLLRALDGGPSVPRSQRSGPTPPQTAGQSITPDDGTATLRRYVQTQLELLTVVFAAMILVSATVGGTVGVSLSSGGGGGGSGDSDSISRASLVNTSDQLIATGPISLSPRVRMLVYSNQSRYWRTAAYDRYTGDGWVRTGQSSPYEGNLTAPPGQTERVEQTVEPRTALAAMPAANQPTTVEGQRSRTMVTTQRTIEPEEPLTSGDNYTVVSQQPTADPDTLRGADDYSQAVERYQQLPESTPDRVAERAEEVAGDEPTAYDTAVAVERHLETSKNYSTLVQRPEGDVADGFLFEMDAGYCTYFATTMAVMLRAQNVPARVAVGYTPGQRLERENGTDAHVVRGFNAHVWVEVYFEDVGWIAFDPTPGGPRTTVEYQRLRDAREQGTLSGIDTAGSSAENPYSELNGSTLDSRVGRFDATNASAVVSQSNGGEESPLPPPRTIGLWLVGLLGVAAVTRRNGGFARVRDAVTRYYQPRESPTADVERAWQRLEAKLGRDHRPRRPTESARSYVGALDDSWPLDPRVYEVLEHYERSRYAGAIDQEAADAAVENVNNLTRRTLPLIGRRYG